MYTRFGEELGINITAVNNASAAFQSVRADAASTSISLRAMASEVRDVGVTAMAIGQVAEMFGLLKTETARAVAQFGIFVSLSASIIRGLHTIASASWLVTAAEKARAIAHAVAHALSGPGGWAILAAAAVAAGTAIGWATAQIQAASSAISDLPDEKTVKVKFDVDRFEPRLIQRAGEEGLWEYFRRREDEEVGRSARTEELARYRQGIEEP